MIEIRSYRRVFDLERRVYSIDSLRLNPAGVPVRGILYFTSMLIGCLVVAGLPLVGPAAQAVPWYLRDLALPGVLAAMLSMVRIEGRTFHAAALAVVGCWLGPRTFACLHPCAPLGRRWYPQDILILPDGSDAQLRRLRYRGPGAVVVTVAHERVGRLAADGSSGLSRPGRRAALMLRQASDGRQLERPQVILLSAGACMHVRPGAADVNQ